MDTLVWKAKAGEYFSRVLVLTTPDGLPFVPSSLTLELYGQLIPYRALPATEQFTLSQHPTNLNRYTVTLTEQQVAKIGSRGFSAELGFSITVNNRSPKRGLFVIGNTAQTQQPFSLYYEDTFVNFTVITDQQVLSLLSGIQEEILLTSAETIAPDQPVCYTQSGLQVYDSTNPLQAGHYIGIAITGGVAGTGVRIRTRGQMTITGRDIQPGVYYRVGIAGNLVSAGVMLTTDRFVHIVGRGIGPNTLLLQDQPILHLAN